ncbi:hypothetical protein LJR084_006829 [Variovorax sp. LjRoot84]
MPSFALRFVGQEALPSRLSEFDREQFFELTPADIAAIREQSRSDHRLPSRYWSCSCALQGAHWTASTYFREIC